jgi:hypothetical protein
MVQLLHGLDEPVDSRQDAALMTGQIMGQPTHVTIVQSRPILVTVHDLVNPKQIARDPSIRTPAEGDGLGLRDVEQFAERMQQGRATRPSGTDEGSVNVEKDNSVHKGQYKATVSLRR